MKGGREGGTEGRKRGRGKKEKKKKKREKKSPDYSIFQFLWCKYSHRVDFKPTNDLLTSLQNSWISKNWLSQTWRNHLLYTQLSLCHGHVRSVLPALEDEIAAHRTQLAWEQQTKMPAPPGSQGHIPTPDLVQITDGGGRGKRQKNTLSPFLRANFPSPEGVRWVPAKPGTPWQTKT